MKHKAFKRIEELKKSIRYHDHLYYNLDQIQITDFEYDKLLKELEELEKKHPDLKSPDSPSQKVPGKALSQFSKQAHSEAMLSLQNSYSVEELKSFYQKTANLLKDSKPVFFMEPKIDGIAVELIYKNGLLKTALSRGDGKLGEDITAPIKTLRGLSLSLPQKVKILEARGEVFILKQDFKRINEEMELAGLTLFANPRNLASGSLRQLDPKVTAERPLHCFIHSPGGLIPPLNSQEDFIKMIQKFKLPSLQLSDSKKLKPPLKLCKLAHSMEDIESYYEDMQKLRHELPFEIDGIVLKVNNFNQQKQLGAIARSPRWAMAGKFPAEQGVTKLEKIKLQVGRTGVITPVAVLKALNLGGVVLRHASLHNFKELERKGFREGDMVLVHRAGDVIPELIKVHKRNKKAKAFLPPNHCPVCKSLVKAHGDYLICTNSHCPAVIENKLIHFASKKAMNIEFLGEKSIKKFYDWGWLKSYADLYDLKGKTNLKDKSGFGEKSYQLLVESLEKSKSTSLARFLFALGIPLIGEQTAEKISEKVYEIHGKKSLNLPQAVLILKKLSLEEWEEIPDIGPLAAQSLMTAIANKDLEREFEKLHDRGIVFSSWSHKKSGETLKGLNFVITGTLPIARLELKAQIQDQAGKVSSQISSKTNFLIAGASPGSKKEKAQKLSIPTLTYDEFLELVKRKR